MMKLSEWKPVATLSFLRLKICNWEKYLQFQSLYFALVFANNTIFDTVFEQPAVFVSADDLLRISF